jgi:carbamoyltransferase
LKKEINIIGISCYYHDSAAALIKNGIVLSAIQEERLSRIKHDSSFPKNSIKKILKINNLKLSDIDHIIFYEKPFVKFERLMDTYVAFAPRGIRSYLKSIPLWISEKLFQKKKMIQQLNDIEKIKKIEKKIKFSEHHLSHAASTFYPSPFKEALILTIDGVGERVTTSVALGKENKINIIKEIHFPHSLGLLYSSFTHFLGFKVNDGEYKVMGLAPYGQPIFKDLIYEKLIDLKDDGSFRLNMDYFEFATNLKMIGKKFENVFKTKIRRSNEKISQFHMDVASSIQIVLEEIILKLIFNLKKENPEIENLCLAGGVALNCVANGKILKSKIFKNIWIQPASGDAGGSIGAALAYWNSEYQKVISKDLKLDYFDPRLGTEYSNNEIEDTLKKFGAKYSYLSDYDLLKKTANLLSQKKVIGWFQGRMEFGPRALGSRSILADPRDKFMQRKINMKIKYREGFRPFAPIVMEEHVKLFFDIETISPYMLLVAKVLNKNLTTTRKDIFLGFEKLKNVISEIPAVTHVDYSARIQTVSNNRNVYFYDLIKKFKEKTGCPVLLNTSFNIRGEPIVNTPSDAFNCFMGTDLDYLVIGNIIIDKKKQNLNFIKNYKNRFKLD